MQHHRPDFTDDLPLSRAATKKREVGEAPEADGDDVPVMDGWDAVAGAVTWTKSASEWYADALDEGGYKAAAGKAAKFTKRVPVVGHVITVAGVGNDIRNGESAGRSTFVAVAGVGGTMLGVGALALLAPAAPIVLVAAAGVGGALLLSKGAEIVADRYGKGAAKVASAVSGGAKSAWKAIF